MTDTISNHSVAVNPNSAVSGLNKVISAFQRLTSISDKSSNNITRQFKSMSKGFKMAGAAMSKTVNFIANALSNLATQIAVVFGFSELVDAARRVEKFETTFLTFTGTLRKARAEINHLLGVTNAFGVSFEAAVIPFAKFAAATQDMAKSDIRGIFVSFIEASSALQLNMQEVNGVFLALQQIASKGRVSMEELRLQLAERIPGTMIIAANAMKMTMMEFEKAARTGALNVNKFLLEFAKGIHDKFGPAAELAASRLFAKMNRLSNALLFFKERLFTTGAVGKSYSAILEDITNKLNDTEIATGAISNVLGELLEKIEAFVSGTTADDINDWINSFTVLAKTIGIAAKAAWNINTAIFKVGTESTSVGKLIRWPFDLAAAFDLARDGLLDFNSILAASSFTELHTLVADVMTVDQELQKLRTSYTELEGQIDKLTTKLHRQRQDTGLFSMFGDPEKTKQELLEAHEALNSIIHLIEKRETLLGTVAMKGDPQLTNLVSEYEKAEELLEDLFSKRGRQQSHPMFTIFSSVDDTNKEIKKIQELLYTLDLAIQKRKEYFGLKFDEAGEEVDIVTKTTQPPSMKAIEQAGRFIDRNNKLMKKGYSSLLSTHDRTINQILDSYNEFHTTIRSYVSKDPKVPGILTEEEASKYISEMRKFTKTMYDHTMANRKVSSELTIFNSALQTAKDSLLPEYEAGLKKINDEYDRLNLLAKSAAKMEGWDTSQLEAKLDKIKTLREAALSSYDEKSSVKELSYIELKEQAYIDLYESMGILTNETYEILRSKYAEDRDAFYMATDNKALAYAVFNEQMRELDAQMLDSKEETTNVAEQMYAGMSDGIDTYLEKTKNVSEQVELLMVSAFQNMEDALVEFCISGKLNFKDFAKSVIKDILRIMVKQLILNAVMAGISAFSGGAGASGASAAGSAAPASAATPTTGMGASPQVMAKGGVFDSPGLSAYSGQVVNSPTHFAFARGMGLMGEAGPEAIMPLTRMPGGDLGVKTETETSAPVPMQVNIHEAPNTHARVEQSDDGKNLTVVIEQVEQEMQSRMTRGTGMAPFMDGRYGRG